jgi:hypothetical protein
VVYVFDVSQTEGEELPEVAPLRLEGEAPAGIMEALEQQVADAGFTLRREAIARPSCNGYADFERRLVVLRDDICGIQALKTLIHELAPCAACTPRRICLSARFPRSRPRAWPSWFRVRCIAPELTLDLVAVSAFDIQGTTALVPQRVDPEQIDVASPAPKPKPTGQILDGGEAFAAWIQHEPEEQRAVSETIYKWARDLEDRNLVRLRCAQTSDVTTLIVIPRLHEASMASAWKGRLYLYRSVFERLAPESIPAVELAVAPNRLGQGTVAPQVDTALLSALTVAYEEAATTS